MALIQRIPIPERYRQKVTDLIDIIIRCAAAMIEGVEFLFSNYVQATVAVGKVDELESEADRLEIELIEKIFSDNLDGTEKILMRDLVDHLSGIADKAENVGDRIRLMAAKRSV